MDTTKCCTKCGEEKPRTLEFFHTNKRSSDGLRPDCRACTAERQRKYREANPEKVSERQRKYREANREKQAEYSRKYREANPEKVSERHRKYRDLATYAAYLAELTDFHDRAEGLPKGSPERAELWAEATRRYHAARVFALRHGLEHPREVLAQMGYRTAA
jgi:hypothetical protein